MLMIRLDVWLTLPSGESVKAGSLVVADPDTAKGGRLQGQFRYTPGYLEHPGAFALDPLNLPLSAENFDANRPRAGVHGVFEDSLPDDWGRRLMIRRYNLNRDEARVPNLLRLLGGKGLGPPNLETLLTESKYFGIKRRQEALNKIMEIHAAVLQWPDIFRECHVPARDGLGPTPKTIFYGLPSSLWQTYGAIPHGYCCGMLPLST